MKKLILSMAFLTAGAVSYAQTGAGSIWLGGSIGFGSAGGSTEISGAPAGNGTTDAPSTTNLNFSPTGYYFIGDDLAVGASITFGSNSTSQEKYYNKTTGTTTVPGPGFSPGANDVKYDDKTTNTGFGINLYANKFNDLSDKWKWYYGASLGFNNGSGTMTNVKMVSPGNYTTEEKPLPSSMTVSLGANLGVSYFLNENWAFVGGLNNLFSLAYTSSSSETALPLGGTSTAKTNNLNLSVGTGTVTSGAISFGVFYVLK